MMGRWRRDRRHRRAASSLAAVVLPSDLRLPLFILLCWVALWLLILTRRPDRRFRVHRYGDAWLPTMTGPSVEADVAPMSTDHGGWQITDAFHSVRLLVVPPHRLGTFADIGGTVGAAAALDDLGGPVLDAGRRNRPRSWRGLLLHGDHAEAAVLARALAGEHGVPLLSIGAATIVAADQRSAARPVFQHAQELAPCVLLLDRVDQLDQRGDDLASGRQDRRIVGELARELRAMPEDGSVVVVASADDIDAVPPILRDDHCLDRPITIRPPTAVQRQRIVRREALLHGAILDADDVEEVTRITEDLTSSTIVDLVGRACRTARHRRSSAEVPLVLRLADIRAALHLPPDAASRPSRIGRRYEQCLQGTVAALADPRGNVGLVVGGLAGNGKTTVARWLAARSARTTVWLRGEDIDAVPMEDVDALMAGAAAQVPVLVVFDGLDDVLADRRGPASRVRKHLLAGIGQLLHLPGAAVVITMRDPGLLDPPISSNSDLDLLWLPHPSYHERLELLEQMLSLAVLVGFDLRELAAAQHGLTRQQVVDACAAAIRAAVLRHRNGNDRRHLYRQDFANLR